MENKYVNWVKVYHVNHLIGPIRFYLSSHKDGTYHGMVIYAKRKGNWSEGSVIELNFEDQRIYGNDENFVYNGAMEFINNNLGENYSVTLFSETEMKSMEKVKNKTFEIIGKQFIKLTSRDQSINFKIQQVRLEIFVDNQKIPKYNRLCSSYVDLNQVDPSIIQFPTNGENMEIVAYSDDLSVDLDNLLITGF